MRKLALAATLAALAGCPAPDAAPDATPCSLELAWGPRRVAGFRAFVDGDRAEITLGFQGFRYISSSLRAELAEEPTPEDRMWAQIAVDGHEVFTITSTLGMSSRESDGARYADDVLVFFNDIPIPQLVGREADIEVRARVGGCAGSYRARVTLVDDDDCVEQSDGTLLCE